MPLIVNGEMLPQEFVDAEASRLASHPDFLRIENEAERLQRLRSAAEESAVNRMLIAQAAARDPRPVLESDIQRECQAFQARNGGHGAYDAHVLRSQVEARLRVKRIVEEIRKQAPAPAEEAIRETYDRYKDDFQSPERVRAAHIGIETRRDRRIRQTAPPEILVSARHEIFEVQQQPICRFAGAA